MYTLNLYPILESQDISVSRLSRATGIGYAALLSYCSGNFRSIKFEDIERICISLDCSPKDIISYSKTDINGVEVLVKRNESKDICNNNQQSSLEKLREINRLRFD